MCNVSTLLKNRYTYMGIADFRMVSKHSCWFRNLIVRYGGNRSYLNLLILILSFHLTFSKLSQLRKELKGQINQNFDIFSFNPIYLLCVDLVSNKHILKFQVNWT